MNLLSINKMTPNVLNIILRYYNLQKKKSRHLHKAGEIFSVERDD